MNVADWPRTDAGNPWAVYRGWRVELFRLANGEVGVMVQERVMGRAFECGSDAAAWALDQIDVEMERSARDSVAWARIELERWAEERAGLDAFRRWVEERLDGRPGGDQEETGG
jgi:hypothetical protein